MRGLAVPVITDYQHTTKQLLGEFKSPASREKGRGKDEKGQYGR
jgi:hypothetical protein